MFSRQFATDHPRAGEPTYFVEKLIFNFLEGNLPGYGTEHIKRLRDLGYLKVSKMLDGSKGHTIRAGHRFKKGDKFSPRIWSGKPYRSGQIILGPDVEVVNTWDFKVDQCGVCSLNNRYLFDYDTSDMEDGMEITIAKNDGLNHRDFLEWIIMPYYRAGKSLDAQIICWDPTIDYSKLKGGSRG